MAKNKSKKPLFKPRNPSFAILARKRGGAHQKTEKAIRRKNKIELGRRDSDEESPRNAP